MAGHAHAHEEHSGDDLIDAARITLTDSGEQWTGMRQSVFEELARHEKPASNVHPAFEISGLGQLVDAHINSDRLVTFGANQ